MTGFCYVEVNGKAPLDMSTEELREAYPAALQNYKEALSRFYEAKSRFAHANEAILQVTYAQELNEMGLTPENGGPAIKKAQEKLTCV